MSIFSRLRRRGEDGSAENGRSVGPRLPETLPPCCHAHPDSTDLTGTRRNGTGIATREIDCKTAPHVGLDRLGLADSIPVPPTRPVIGSGAAASRSCLAATQEQPGW